MLGDAIRKLRDDEGSTYALALVRVGFGLLFLNEAWLAWQHFSGAGFFGDYFHQPYLPESLIPSRDVYELIILAQGIAALLIVLGRGARPALLVASALLIYSMLCDRLWFHNYRHTMAAFATLLAFAPCDRQWVASRPPRTEKAPIWAQHAMKVQVSVMYLASAGSKLLDPEWRGGRMMRGMVRGFAHLLKSRGMPPGWLLSLETPLGASLLAKGAILTELSLAFLLWWPKTRRPALWIGLFFHLSISLMTPVQLFTAEMLLVYLLFATPDWRARSVVFDPAHPAIPDAVRTLDWLQRFEFVAKPGVAGLRVIGRDGEERTRWSAAAEIFGSIPLLFPVWPAVAIVAAVVRPESSRASAG
jgi:hypothetical protein